MVLWGACIRMCVCFLGFFVLFFYFYLFYFDLFVGFLKREKERASWVGGKEDLGGAREGKL